jgi:triosephosphate isomerase (TIM)
MPERRPYVAANWKMHKTSEEARDFIRGFLERLPEAATRSADVVICPTYTALPAVVDATRGTGVRVAAQNMHEAESGAYTGEVSAAMIAEAGATAVVLGHSERRRLFGETDEALARKVPAALAAGLEPILCVGETEEERDAERMEEVLERQIRADLTDVGSSQLERIVVAYEPVWAIGTGRTATPEQAEDAIRFVRGLLAETDRAAAERIRILYGGSVNPDNADELISRPQIDGALVGGASLESDEFAAIAETAAVA